jgi:WD40 repeat protein
MYILNDTQIIVRYEEALYTINLTELSHIQLLKGNKEMISNLIQLEVNKIASTIGNKIKIWCLVTDSCISIFEGHTSDINKMLIYSNNIILTCSSDKTIKFWNSQSVRCFKTITTNEPILDIISIGKSIINTSLDKSVKIIQREGETLIDNKYLVTKLIYLQNGIIAGGGMELVVWNMRTLQRLYVNNLNFLINPFLHIGKSVLMCRLDNRNIVVIDYKSKRNKVLISERIEITDVKILNREKLVCYTNDYCLKIFDLSNVKLVRDKRILGHIYLDKY